ncbi:retrovirus-related pol polyprotein from transposon TNT 1-94 [Tanacetum coccineum]|uniref:Retrovirus-related pol polyprotein from transposon TNT 1-94 n=1 Tax=Tanacetum coccineum TaxID=301880 RepID=A0ABQ5DSR9_9ASTR
MHVKRNIVGVDDVVEEDDYNQLDELPPFSSGIQSLDEIPDDIVYLRSDHQKGHNNLRKCIKIMDGGLQHVMVKCSGLKNLNLYALSSFTDEAYKKVSLLAHLEFLDLCGTQVKNNKEAHEYYLKHTMEEAAILKEVVEQAKSRNPLDSASYLACMYVKLIQELLGYLRDTCPNIHKPSDKLVVITPINKKKTIRLANTVTPSGNIPKVTNRPLLSSTGVDPSTSASGSKPSGNTKNDKIPQTPSSNQKNKVEVQSRKVKSSLNKKNSDSKNVCNEHVRHPVKGAMALCSVCNACLFDVNHAMCLIDHVNSMNMRAKSASKKNKKRKEGKPTGKVFNSVGYKWKPTIRTFTLVTNECPLTRRPKVPKSFQNSKPKVAKSMTAKRMEPGTSQGSDTLVAPSSSSLIDCGTFKIGNDQVAKIMGYGDYQIGNVTISRVYYVERLGHNLFSVGSRGTNLYSLSIGDMMASSPICLLSKATKTKSWLWHRRLSCLNFGAINHLARHGLVRGLPILKFEKDHLCSACAMGKSKK